MVFQSYIGSLLNSPPSVLLRKVPHHNSMPSSRGLGLRRTSAGGSVVTNRQWGPLTLLTKNVTLLWSCIILCIIVYHSVYHPCIILCIICVSKCIILYNYVYVFSPSVLESARIIRCSRLVLPKQMEGSIWCGVHCILGKNKDKYDVYHIQYT